MAKEKHFIQEDVFTKITKKLEKFIVKHLKTILISISIAVVIVIVYFSVDYFIKKKQQVAFGAFDKVYLVYSELVNDQDLSDEEREDKLITLTEDFQLVADTYPDSKAAMKSAYYAGNILIKAEKYEQAIQFYEKGSEDNKEYYISALCLQKLAICYEQLDELEKAAKTYQKILEEYEETYIIPTILFNLGQVLEKQDKLEKADEQYSLIVSAYQWSSWKDFAEKRQLLLKNFM
jgi:tetratricopeptide (TPR) repeat protein